MTCTESSASAALQEAQCPATTTATTSKSIQPKYCILCVGFCVLDFMHVCDVYPKENMKSFTLSSYWQRGGNCSNMCTVLRNLNANCEFFGMMTDSPNFQVLQQDCRNRGIEIKNCPLSELDPVFSSVFLSLATGSRTAIHNNNGYSFPKLNYSDFCKLNLNNYTWIHFEATNPVETLQMIQMICHFNKKYRNNDDRITISLDIENNSTELIELAEYVDYIVMGKELAKANEWKTPYAAVEGLRNNLKTQAITGYRRTNIIAPWGEQGAAYLSCSDEFELLPAQPPEVIVDTLGAGDTFCAALVFALHVLGKNLRDAISFANHIAGYKIGHRGYDKIGEYFTGKYGH